MTALARRTAILTLVLTFLPLSMTFGFEDDRFSPWERLPQSTLGAVRLKSDAELAQKLIEETQFGKVFLDEARLSEFFETLLEALSEEGDANQGTMMAAFLEQEWSSEELIGMFAGEMGIAYIKDDAGDQDPCSVIWLNPSSESADSLWQLLDTWMDEEGQQREGFEAVNIDIDQLDATWLNQNLGGGSLNAILARRGNHLAISVASQRIDVSDEDACVEFLSEQLSRVLDGDMPSGDGFEYAEGIPLPDAAGSAEENFLEMAGDIQAVAQLIIEQTGATEEDVAKIARLTGYEDMEFVVFAIAYGDQLIRQSLRAQWPAPRIGLGKILDTEQSAFATPDWVPATAHSVSQNVLELDAIFQIVESVVREEFPETASSFEFAKGQLKVLLEVEIEELLAGLGTKGYALTFPIDSEAVEAAMESMEGDLQEPTAIVWELEDAELIEKVARQAIKLVPPGPFEETDEQGYFGLRGVGGPFEIGAVIGNGYLVIGIGDGVLEQVLSAITNPPSGRDAFAKSEVYDIGLEMLSGEPGMRLDITDGNSQQQAAFQALEAVVEQMQLARDEYGEEDFALTLFESLLGLMPSAEESEGSLGVMVNEIRANSEGLVFESLAELPAPK